MAVSLVVTSRFVALGHAGVAAGGGARRFAPKGWRGCFAGAGGSRFLRRLHGLNLRLSHEHAVVVGTLEVRHALHGAIVFACGKVHTTQQGSGL